MIATMAKLIGHLPQLPTRIPPGSSFSPLMIINSLQTITTSLMGCQNLRNIARKGNMLPRILIIITLNKSQARDMSHRKKPLSQMPIIVTEALRTLSSLKPVLPLVVVVAITHSIIRITIIRISPQESWREVHRRRWMTTGQCSPNNSTRGGRRRT